MVMLLKRIGIPRGLLFYTFFPFWKTFFEQLGLEVVVSSPSSKTILDEGVRMAVDETCLPVKIFYGHVLDLCEKVDYLFIPRIVSIEPRTFICPKFMGLPEMIRMSISGLPEIIDTCIDMSKNTLRHFRTFRETGLMFTSNIPRIFYAYHKAAYNLQKYRMLMLEGYLPCEAMNMLDGKAHVGSNHFIGNIAVLGHAYNVHDEYVNMNIIDKLKSMGMRPLTLEMMPSHVLSQNSRVMRKEIFWAFGKQILGAAEHFKAGSAVDGIIYLTSFGCGPDSMTGEIVERRCYRSGSIPFIRLNLDEHSGQAGLLTRLEAFVDMIRLKKTVKSECH
jgi:predicted nucleotide-binding protein (sugar kinase/HSP70/actin superfamily)